MKSVIVIGALLTLLISYAECDPPPKVSGIMPFLRVGKADPSWKARYAKPTRYGYEISHPLISFFKSRDNLFNYNGKFPSQQPLRFPRRIRSNAEEFDEGARGGSNAMWFGPRLGKRDGKNMMYPYWQYITTSDANDSEAFPLSVSTLSENENPLENDLSSNKDT